MITTFTAYFIIALICFFLATVPRLNGQVNFGWVGMFFAGLAFFIGAK